MENGKTVDSLQPLFLQQDRCIAKEGNVTIYKMDEICLKGLSKFLGLF